MAPNQKFPTWAVCKPNFTIQPTPGIGYQAFCIFTGMKRILGFLFILNTCLAQEIAPDALDKRIPMLIDKLLTALLETNTDSGFAHCVTLLDTTMFRLYPQKMKYSYISAHEGANLYALPAKINSAILKNKNWKGEWIDVYLGYKEGIIGDGRIVRVFLPADGTRPTIVNFSDL